MKHRIHRIHRRRLTEATDFKAIERLVKSTIDNIVADIENDGFIMDTKDGKRVRVQGLKKHELPRAQEQFEELVVDALQSQEPNFYGWDVYQDEIEAGWQKLVDLSNGRYASEDDFTTSRIANTLDNLLPMNVQLREEDFIEAGYDNPEDWEDERVLEYVLAKSYGYYPTAVDNVVNTNNGIVSVNGIEWDRSRPFVNEDEEVLLESSQKTSKALRATLQSVNGVALKVGYCDLQNLLKFEEKYAHNAGVYGWNYDCYWITDPEAGDVFINTGYRSMFGKDVNYNLVKKYDDAAYEVLTTRGSSNEEKKAKIEELLSEFIHEALA